MNISEINKSMSFSLRNNTELLDAQTNLTQIKNFSLFSKNNLIIKKKKPRNQKKLNEK